MLFSPFLLVMFIVRLNQHTRHCLHAQTLELGVHHEVFPVSVHVSLIEIIVKPIVLLEIVVNIDVSIVATLISATIYLQHHFTIAKLIVFTTRRFLLLSESFCSALVRNFTHCFPTQLKQTHPCLFKTPQRERRDQTMKDRVSWHESKLEIIVFMDFILDYIGACLFVNGVFGTVVQKVTSIVTTQTVHWLSGQCKTC